ncbi:MULTISPECIES: LAGLIDADG family homing endonuclease [Halorubrum]|uniref:DNA helicase n=1 Tax=Halorubrum hochstenium ATCC 700873 TaxID=1227481 RepID=M0F375_9EURY|nr:MULTISPECIES: LAGLIDADG family homing endonuclease [Halorubrum]ELZ54491.1 replicative DNA helicase / cell division control protein 21 /MCM [Halorubrum hochstenium ATCC 700873]
MAQAGTQDLTERFIQFYRNYYREEIGQLAQRYPNEERSLYVSYDDLFQFDRDLAEDFLNKPEQMREYAEEALRLYDLPADVSLGRAHVRIEDLPESVDIRGIRVHDDHIGKLVSVQGIVRKATDVRPKVTEAAFECQRCGTMTYIPQSDGGFQEPHECQGCERQGPFRVNFDQSEFVDSQKLRIQESPEGLRGGETPQSLDVDIVDDITGEVSPGDHVTCVGVLHIEQVEQGNEKSAIFDLYMDGVSISIEDEEFEDMDITEADKRDIIELSERDDIYEAMVGSIAPAIYGYEEEKLAMILQLFSGVTKHLPDGSRIRGDLHMLLIGDPGTGKCLKGDTRVTLGDGRKVPIRDLVEDNLNDSKPVDDGVFDEVDFEVPSLRSDGTVGSARATKVWKREAPETMYRVETASGAELEVTPSHPLFVQRDGRFEAVVADELNEGEFVAAPNRLNVEGDDAVNVEFRRAQSHNAVRLDLPDEWTPDLARLLGYIVAEGYVERRDDHSGFVSITNNDEAVLSDARSTLETLGLQTTTREPHDGKDARELLCSAGEFVSFLENLDEVLLEGSADQRIPRPILGASPSATRMFIKGFVEGEAHVSAKQREITVASMSETLLTDLRTLLLQHGITSQLHERKNGSHRLRISGAQFDRYVTEIGFVTDRKQEAAEEHLETDRNTNLNVVPNVAPVLRRVRDALGLTQYECGVPRNTYRHYEAGSRNPSVGALRNVVEAFEAANSPSTNSTEIGSAQTDGGGVAADIAALRQLVDDDIRWDRIESIEPVNPEDDWVYDLEVEGTHNYVSNGIISHNSQMISYVENIAPRSVYTSGKGSSAAGLTAAAVRDDFGDGQQWSLEAGALVLADKGIAAVDELDKMDCVTGDTLVTLSDGRVERIDELAREAAEDGEIEELSNGRRVRDVDLAVWSMDENGRLVERPVSAVHEYDAPAELTRVTMETGESLRSTADHPFFVLDDGERVEREAAALDEGDWVYVPREVPTAAADGGGAVAAAGGDDAVPGDGGDGVDAAMGSVLGYLSGDGNVYYDRDEGVYGVRFTNADRELLDDFERAAREAFGTEPTRYPSEKRDSVETVRVHGKEHADAVLNAGMNLGRYDEKCFPTPVSTGSRAAKAAFVRALADSEGHVDESAGNIRIASASRDLLRGTRNILLQFGVSSQLQHRERSGGRDVYYLTVTDADSLAAFRRFVGFTASRKASSLDRVVEAADGDRTILDVIPEVDEILAGSRESLRLHQDECGLDAGTYHDFESGAANVSVDRAGRVLGAFEARTETAGEDLTTLESDPTWDALAELRHRYHVPQSELAEGTDVSQQRISREWGDSEAVRRTVTARLREIVGGVAETDLSDLREFVRGDVKWRRVESVETVPPESTEHRGGVLRQRLADVIGGPVETVEERARELVDRGPVGETRAELSAALDAYGVSQADVASSLDVTQATVSRWLSGAVETERLDDLREAVAGEVADVKAALRSILTRIEDGERPRVYDLTVEGTHNFVANGLVVHNSSDRSAMHEGLEQQKISVSKAGINATLKARCSLLGAANPKYGRFDQYEPIGEQIDLEPALISRFDLIFTVTDSPDPEHDSRLAQHIIKTNYAGELNTQREELASSEFTSEQVAEVTEEVAPEIDAELLRKYVAHAKRSCFPTMTDEAKELIEEFYVDLRSKGADEDAPVPVTARKLEAMVRLSEASARVRLSDTVEREDADRATNIVESCLKDIGVDPETGQFDADVVETGTSKSQRDRIKNIKGLIADIEEEYQEGAPVDEVLDRAGEIGMDPGKAEQEIEKLRTKGEVYEPQQGHLRTT